MTQTRIIVSHDRFKVGDEYPWLAERDEDGAVVTFTGKVRNHNLGDSVKAISKCCSMPASVSPWPTPPRR